MSAGVEEFSNSALVSLPGLDAGVVIHSLERLDEIESAWCHVAQNFPGPIEQFEWTKSCLPALTQSGQPFVVVSGNADEANGIAPLLLQRRFGFDRLEMIGVEALAEPADLVYRDQAALEKLLHTLRRLGMPLFLPRVVADSPTVEAIRRVYRSPNIVVCRPRAPYPYIKLDETWKSPESHLNPGRRSDLRRAHKKAEAVGAVTCDVICPQPSELQPLFNLAIDIEARSWKGDASTALATDPLRREFFWTYAQAACRRGTLRLCFLKFGGEPAAMLIAIERANRLWLLKIGYDPKFAKMSAGMLITRETIAYAANNGLESYEFLGTVQPWTQVWTSSQRECVAIRAYPPTTNGLAHLTFDAVRRLLWPLRRRSS
jgi:CelD/BcsL family acetyltransferase involved in cellulose biosynthesis